ncbi:MAG: DUF2520 domain-containing protein, partial [Acidobacteria bacterium]|nr:DUF2520 domain-containing protein [Acidobacteriota bacterium]
RIRETAELAACSPELPGKIFFHTSNSLSSEELLVLKSKGALTASFSPLQTFTGFDPTAAAEANLFKGIYFLAEGDEKALKVADEIAGNLGSHVLKVDKNKKIYFHIAAVCASNFLIALFKLAENQLYKTVDSIPGQDVQKIPDIKIMLPLIRQTVENAAVYGVEASLTGPAKRKEMGIIQQHLQCLEGNEAALYKSLTDFLLK